MNKEQQEILDEVYKNYEKITNEFQFENPIDDFILKTLKGELIEFEFDGGSDYRTLTQEEFINKCKTDSEFSEKWGLKIEERELSDDERSEIRDMQYFKNNLYQALKGSDTKIDWENIPTKLITITYNDKTIESYENV
jgi:hypothetical protein